MDSMNRKLLFACVLSTVFASFPLAASVVYQQNSTYVPPNGTDNNFAWTSAYSSVDGGVQTFDNFTVSKDSHVNVVQWIGYYRDAVNGSNNPVLPDTVTWDLSVYGDNSGVPGASLYNVQESAASVKADQLGTTVRGSNTVFVYEFTATLPTAFSVAANTTYWFSPLSVQSSVNPIFAWLDGTGADNSSYQNLLNPDGTVAQSFVRSQDRAFTLISTPEPASFELVGTFLLVIATRFRKFVVGAR